MAALLSARNPLLYVGEGIFYADATAELLQLAELAQIPVLTTLKAKSAFPDNHPLALGVRGDPAISFLTDCDLLLAIGTSLVPGHFAHGIPNANHKTIIQCCVDERDINRSYQVGHALLGDAKLTLHALIEELERAGGIPRKPGRIEAIAAARERFMASYRLLLVSDEKPINPYRVYGDLMKVLDRHNSSVSPDSGTPATRRAPSTRRSFRGAFWAGATSVPWASAWRRLWQRNWYSPNASASLSPATAA